MINKSEYINLGKNTASIFQYFINNEIKITIVCKIHIVKAEEKPGKVKNPSSRLSKFYEINIQIMFENYS